MRRSPISMGTPIHDDGHLAGAPPKACDALRCRSGFRGRSTAGGFLVAATREVSPEPRGSRTGGSRRPSSTWMRKSSVSLSSSSSAMKNASASKMGVTSRCTVSSRSSRSRTAPAADGNPVHQGEPLRPPPGLLVQPGVLDRRGKLVGDRLLGEHVHLAEGVQLAALHVQHADHPVAAENRHGELGPGLCGVQQRDVAWFAADVSDQQGPPRRGNPPADSFLPDLQAEPVHVGRCGGVGGCAEHQLVARDEEHGNGEVVERRADQRCGLPEQLVDPAGESRSCG